MIQFEDLLVHINNIKEDILSDITYNDSFDSNDEEEKFSNTLQNIKSWYNKVSHANKKRYIIALLRDVKSAWTLSLVLKSIWNSQTKDAVMSANQKVPWSSFDQVPMDNNRTTMPLKALKETMINDRKWFCSLSTENQAIALMQLLMISGLPIVLDALKEGTAIYERYRQEQLDSIKGVVPPPDILKDNKEETEKQSPVEGNAQLEAAMASWKSTVKSFRDSLKMDEIEVNLVDGSNKKIWLLNRAKPETFETLDYLQLLPTSIAKMILTYVPLNQYAECARVNKYWASLIEELKLELTTRVKINMELQKLQDLINQNEMKNDDTLSMSQSSNDNTNTKYTSESAPPKPVNEQARPSSSYRQNRVMIKSHVVPRSVLKLKEVTEKLDRRGAADENFFNWCNNIIKVTKKCSHDYKDVPASFQKLQLNNKQRFIEIPMKEPLIFDNTNYKKAKAYKKLNITHKPLLTSDINQVERPKKNDLWKTNHYHLYPAYKILSYQSPI